MGSGASSKLVCPDDYDKDKFSKIRKLFDELDNNGDNVVESSELDKISKLHIQNQISELEKKKKLSVIKRKKVDTFIFNEAKKKQNEIQKAMLASKVKNDSFSNNELIGFNMKIERLNKLEREEREKLFLKKVSNNKGCIDFWKFFEYMKNRTPDIKNIES
jgi:hypothetical protein